MLLGLSAIAQSANNFDTGGAVKEAPAKPEPKPAAPAQPESGPVIATPSRFVGEPDLAAYVATLSAVFSMKNRATDPFGQLQDPDAPPVIKPSVAKTPRRAAPLKATPFSEIVRLLKVTTIMPGEKQFLVGSRTIKQGETIPFTFRGRNLRVEVATVSAREIGFRNLETGETASLHLNLLPVGMTPGNRSMTAPGMVPDNPNSPIELEPMDHPSDAYPQDP
jgi:hypothetical protein